MSQPDPRLSHEKKDIVTYVQHLGAMSYVEKVFIVGSRSPLCEKQEREDSDWDLMVKRSSDGFISKPRLSPYNLLVDIFPYNAKRTDALEIYPTDETGFLK